MERSLELVVGFVELPGRFVELQTSAASVHLVAKHEEAENKEQKD